MLRRCVGTVLIATASIGLLTFVASAVRAEDPRIEDYLYTVEQDLDLTINTLQSSCSLGDAFTCSQFKFSACTTTLIHRTQLQDLVIRGLLSPQNSTFARVAEKIVGIRQFSECPE
jgi:hypothetical protein